MEGNLSPREHGPCAFDLIKIKPLRSCFVSVRELIGARACHVCVVNVLSNGNVLLHLALLQRSSLGRVLTPFHLRAAPFHNYPNQCELFFLEAFDWKQARVKQSEFCFETIIFLSISSASQWKAGHR